MSLSTSGFANIQQHKQSCARQPLCVFLGGVFWASTTGGACRGLPRHPGWGISRPRSFLLYPSRMLTILIFSPDTCSKSPAITQSEWLFPLHLCYLVARLLVVSLVARGESKRDNGRS